MKIKKEDTFKRIIVLYAFLFVFWGFYRYLFRLPEEVEELVLKPLIWLGVLAFILYKEKANLSSVGWSKKNLFKSLYWGIGLGFVFAFEGFFANFLKYGEFSFIKLSYPTTQLFLTALGVSLVTAVSEETVFRGYIFNRLWKVLKKEWSANLISSTAFVLIHLPITLFVFHYTPGQVAVFALLSFIFGIGSAFLFARTGTVIASVLLHVLWSWPIILFR